MVFDANHCFVVCEAFGIDNGIDNNYSGWIGFRNVSSAIVELLLLHCIGHRNVVVEQESVNL